MDGDPIEVDPDSPHPAESILDPGIGPSTLPPSGPLVPSDQKFNSMSSSSYQMIHLTALLIQIAMSLLVLPHSPLGKGKETAKTL